MLLTSWAGNQMRGCRFAFLQNVLYFLEMAVDSIARAVEQLAKVANQILGPSATRAQAKADAESVVTAACAEGMAADIRQRTKMRLELQDLRHQQNLESIVAGANVLLLNGREQKLLPAPVEGQRSEPDWFFRWSNFAKECSDQEFQNLWSRVLAGEIVQPGRFSPRLLHILSLLRKEEALLFSLFADYVWKDSEGGLYQLWNEQSDDYLNAAVGLGQSKYMILDNLGLVDYLAMTGMPLRDGKVVASYGGANYTFSYNGASDFISIYTRRLSNLGEELFALCTPKPDAAYVNALLAEMRQKEKTCSWKVVVS